jgi:hypothetical protein
MLTPDSKADIGDVVAKIRSKMDTAKVFGAFTTALATFIVGNLPRRATETWWEAVRLVSLATIALAAALFFVTLFYFDRLLMPTRFWGAGRAEPRQRTPTRWYWPRFRSVDRPPSSALWTLYQNMQMIWRRLFVPAVVLVGVSIAAFALAQFEPGGWNLVVAAVASVMTIAGVATWARLSSPTLGVQD